MESNPLNIVESAGQTKIMQLVHSVTEAINKGELLVGDSLPSVNQLSHSTGFSRDTIFKAYSILKQQNRIESTPQKGYFVASESFKVFMLLDDFSAFKEQLYQAFRQNLPDSYSVDLLFHHYNPEVFRQLVQNSLGKYAMYVIMNIRHNQEDRVLKKIDAKKLLILDMGKASEKRNYLLQNFNSSVYESLLNNKALLTKYKKMVMVYEEKSTPHPSETLDVVKRFCANEGIDFKLLKNISAEFVQKDCLYLVIKDADLVETIQICKQKQLKVGNDVGILSYNDTPMKQIAADGISVISTDFNKMGKLAADFVVNKTSLQQILPAKILQRNSL